MISDVSSALAAYRQASVSGLASEDGAAAASEIGGTGGFMETLKGFLTDTVGAVKQGESVAAAGALGKASLEEVVMATNKAELMLQTLIGLRDKMITAYQEISRMAV